MPDIVGIGAVNLDVVVSGEGAGHHLPDGFEFGTERAVSAPEMEEVLNRLSSLRPVTGPGGSALNTVATIAAIGTDVTVGYVGISGRSPTPEFSFDGWFSGLAIDREHLATSNEVAGICLSYTEAGQRSMLTTPGANADIMTYLADQTEELIPYLSSAQLILVTSFADRGGIEPLVDLLRTVRAIRPEVMICCDPGAMWSREPIPDGVPELFRLTDWLLVNSREYELHRAAGRIPAGHTVVKHPDRIEVMAGGATITHRNRLILSDEEITDDTGSGDAFAAGLLLALVTPELDRADGVTLGMDLAREKLRWPGLAGIDRYPEIHRRFIDRRSDNRFTTT